MGIVCKKPAHVPIETELYTIGYEGINIDDFIKQLKTSGVSKLIDVRDIPFSRKKGFSKEVLKETLEDNNIKYFHFKPLGSPASLRSKLKEDGDYDYFFRTYNKYLSQHIDAIKEVIKIISENVGCLMCFEKDHTKCHRSVVADIIEEYSGNKLKIRHIF